ncbi:glycosyltransferase family 4 protein [Candidatus Saccharibacteria bacterium]|nr:glycosyltransferase family 4 protein [Candidatus Saccharibacteria bacterium]
MEQLALRQARQGHEVTIYCHPSSRSEKLHFRGISSAQTDKKINNINTFRLAFSNDHDVYHSHFDNLHYEVAHETVKPIVFTQHWWPTEETINLAKQHQSHLNVWAVAPTKYMEGIDRANGIQTKGYIHHGINLDVFKPKPESKTNRLLCVGRIAPNKHIETALAVAKQSGVGLDIVGKLLDKDIDYWNSISNDIDGIGINYLGQKNKDDLVRLYSNAKAVICTFSEKEAFGLVAIEAQACGTPILITPGGAHAELLDSGKTGFICESIDEFEVAINEVVKIRSEDCINFIKDNFDITEMFEKYEKLYQELTYTS